MCYSYRSIADQVCRELESNPRVTLGSLTSLLGVERHTVTKALRIATGASFRQIRQSIIARKARSFLSEPSTRSVKEIAYSLGFSSPRSLHRAVVRTFRVPPTELRHTTNSLQAESMPIVHEGLLTQSCSIAADVVNLRVQPRASTFSFEPGQYVAVLADIHGKFDIRSYSIASSPQTLSRDGFDLCVKKARKGAVSSWVSQLRVGETVRFLGPFGLFRLRQPIDSTLIFVVTGTGVAPIRSMLKFLIEGHNGHLQRIDCSLLFGERDEGTILYKDEFEAMARNFPGFRFIPVLSDPASCWRGAKGHVQEHLREMLAGKVSFRVYACGHDHLIQDIHSIIREMGFPSSVLVSNLYG